MLNFCIARVAFSQTLNLWGRRLKMILIVLPVKTKEFQIYLLIFECTRHMVCCWFISEVVLRHNRPSVLWRCWLGSRKGIWPVKNWVVGCWHGYLFGARCRLAYGPADATATHCLLLQYSKIQIGFAFLVWAHPGYPGQRAVKWMCVSNK